MKNILEQYSGKINGVFSFFDRMILTGYIRSFFNAMLYFLSAENILLKDYGDYDERIKQRASMLADGELNRYFYTVVYGCLEWKARQYVPGFDIYQYDLNWASKIFSCLRQPMSRLILVRARIRMPIWVRLQCFKKKLIKYLSENRNTCFNVTYKCHMRQLIDTLKDKYNRDMTFFKDTIDLASSICLDDYFGSKDKYPEYPVMKTKITRDNQAVNVRVAFDHFAGRKTQQSTAMLQSFGILDGDKIRPEGSKYASYYIDML